MPMLTISTNVQQKFFTEEMIKMMSSKMAELVGKPEKFVMVIVRGDQCMSFGGTTEPCALCSFESIGCINVEKNTEYTKAICDFMAKVGIKCDRVYVKYEDLSRENMAWNGKLFCC